MKIALITDTHWGARGDNREFLDYFIKFYREVFFPYLKEHGIKTICHLGDIVDRRKYMNYVTLNAMRREFFDVCDEMNIDLHIIVGNHDIPYRASNDINAIGEMFTGHNLALYKDPTVVNFDGLDVLMMPWIHSGNHDACFDLIKNTSAPVIFGHLEIQGAEMYRGMISHDGYDQALFEKFDVVASGHYHTKSKYYLGTPYEMTWSDYNDPKGFHIFDTDTREFTRIVNPFKMFHKVWYDDEGKDMAEVVAREFDQFKDTYVKVIVQTKTNPYWFDLFLGKIYEAKPLEVSIVDDNLSMDTLSDEDIVNSTEDTLTILSGYVKNLETKANKNTLDSLMKTLYNEALNMESDAA